MLEIGVIVDVSRLERMGIVHGVITQNVDSLHQDAGSENIVEIHGSLSSLVCLDCGNKYYIDMYGSIEEELDGVIWCENCESVMKPNMILFGEQIESDVYEKALNLIAKSGVILFVGTSMKVHPVAGFLNLAARHNIECIEVNPVSSGLSAFRSVYEVKQEDFFTEFLDEVKKHKAEEIHMSDSEEFEYTHLGFKVYGRLNDTKGSEIRLQQSSAPGENVYIFTENEQDRAAVPHLNVTDAKRLIVFLQKFIDDAMGKL